MTPQETRHPNWRRIVSLARISSLARQSRIKKTLTVAVAAVTGLAAAACGSSGSAATTGTASHPFKVAYILDGPLNDGGFDTAIDIGMQQVQRTFGKRVQVTYKLNVPESPQATQVINGLVQAGNKMIFATSFGYHTEMAAAAKQYPDVKFIQFESTELAHNLSQYYVGIDQAWYLAGMAAGGLTKDNKLGFVGSFPIPSLLIQVNAFELGAKAVNPKAATRVVWMNSWYDPPSETQAAKSLANSGIDVLADGLDDPAVVQTGEQMGVPVIGHDQPGMQKYAPKEWVTGALFLFGPYYVSQIRAALNGQWKSGIHYGLLKDGETGLASLGPAFSKLPASIQQKIKRQEHLLATGAFNDLTGPIYSQKGTLEIQPGQAATVTQRESMNYLVKGVLGTA